MSIYLNDITCITTSDLTIATILHRSQTLAHSMRSWVFPFAYLGWAFLFWPVFDLLTVGTAPSPVVNWRQGTDTRPEDVAGGQ